jgi:hypothetical protein
MPGRLAMTGGCGLNTEFIWGGGEAASHTVGGMMLAGLPLPIAQKRGGSGQSRRRFSASLERQTARRHDG